MESDTYYSYDTFKRTCPSHTVLETLANKWLYLVMAALKPGKRRYSDLQRKLEGVSPKMLTQTLRVLERDGMIRRKVFPVVPPRVEYELTTLGFELAGLLDHLRTWSETHVPEIMKSREAFQTQAETG
jgi:DNA-binding HxlR family transcriptional regulator